MEQELLSPINQVKSGILKGRAAVELLASTGKYIFHGSGSKLDKLEPRQAHTVDKEGVLQPDGPPAIFATKDPDITIFMAVYSANKSTGKEGGASFKSESGITKFKASPGTIDFDDTTTPGFVHVFDKENFQRYRGEQYTSQVEVDPICPIEVRASDLPEVEITENWHS